MVCSICENNINDNLDPNKDCFSYFIEQIKDHYYGKQLELNNLLEEKNKLLEQIAEIKQFDRDHLQINPPSPKVLKPILNIESPNIFSQCDKSQDIIENQLSIDNLEEAFIACGQDVTITPDNLITLWQEEPSKKDKIYKKEEPKTPVKSCKKKLVLSPKNSPEKQPEEKFDIPKRMRLAIPTAAKENICTAITTPVAKWTLRSQKQSGFSDSKMSPLKNKSATTFQEIAAGHSNIFSSSTRKINSLSLRRSKMKQTTLNFSKITEIPPDYDETFCEGIVIASPTTIKSSRKFKQAKSATVINSDSTVKTQNDKEKLQISDIQSPVTQNNKNDYEESVFFMPNQLGDVVLLDETDEDDDCRPSAVVVKEFVDRCKSYSNKDQKRAIKNEPDSKPTSSDSSEKICKPPNYKSSPVRKKTDRAKLPGYDCPECASYYRFLGSDLTAAQIQTKKNTCSRHRNNNRRLHETPEGFWDPTFPPTPEGETLIYEPLKK